MRVKWQAWMDFVKSENIKEKRKIIRGDDVDVPVEFEKLAASFFKDTDLVDSSRFDYKPETCPTCKLIKARCKCAKIERIKAQQKAYTIDEEKKEEKPAVIDIPIDNAIVEMRTELRKAGKNAKQINEAIKTFKKNKGE